ncbi:MAG: hypothetical protein HKN87_03800 [Saprospiraceae bacterium]|nr:hypothetical protein [Saprospiraceae bacterium]
MKKNLRDFAKVFLAILGLALVTTSCDKDDPVPTTAKIKGTITMQNTDVWAEWQDSGEVQLTLFPDYSLDPPAGWGEVPDEFFGPGVPGGNFALGAPYNAQDPLIVNYEAGATSFSYEIEVEPGTYSALALGFRHDFVTDASRRTATIGVHHGDPATVSYGVQIKINMSGNIVPILDFPAPSSITVAAGDEREIDFVADFGFLPIWYR